MYRTGHIGLTLLITALPSALLSIAISPIWGGLFTVFTLSTTLLPDLDVRLPLPHRGPLHTVWFAALIGVVWGIIGAVWVSPLLESGLLFARSVVDLPGNKLIVRTPSRFIGLLTGTGGATGVLSHLAGDSITVGSGKFAIKPFSPISPRTVRLGWTRADSIVWNIGLLLLGCSAQFLLWQSIL